MGAHHRNGEHAGLDVVPDADDRLGEVADAELLHRLDVWAGCRNTGRRRPTSPTRLREHPPRMAGAIMRRAGPTSLGRRGPPRGGLECRNPGR